MNIKRLELFPSEFEQLLPSAEGLLRRELRNLGPLGGGGNSQVWLLEDISGQRFVLKRYPRDPGDSRDRLRQEFEAFRFLWKHGLRNIPEPLVQDAGLGIAVYAFLPGQRKRWEKPEDLRQALDFLKRCRELRVAEGAEALPLASEACFSFAALEVNLRSRLQRLEELPDAKTLHALQNFLHLEFRPALDDALLKLQDSAPGPIWSETLPSDQRSLSPSDFGFHNALESEGKWYFLDFEYFGWDDPAKTLCDVLLHPGMSLAPDLGEAFRVGFLEDRRDMPLLDARSRAIFPLYALKWTLILLNPFLSGYRLNRMDGSLDDPRPQRLTKAREMLARARMAPPWPPAVGL